MVKNKWRSKYFAEHIECHGYAANQACNGICVILDEAEGGTCMDSRVPYVHRLIKRCMCRSSYYCEKQRIISSVLPMDKCNKGNEELC